MASLIWLVLCLMAIFQQGLILGAIYTGCDDYVCGGYSYDNDYVEWQQCINDNELYHPESFDTNSFCEYCLVEEDGAGPCYCATKSECYSWWYGIGITMIVIGLIVTIILSRQLYNEMYHIYHSIYNKPEPKPESEKEATAKPEPEIEETECQKCGDKEHKSIDCPHFSGPVVNISSRTQSQPKAPELSDNQLFMRRMNWSKCAGCSFCVCVIIGGIVLVLLAATNSGY